MHMLGCLMVSHRPLELCSFFFIPFSFWCSHWVISMVLCPSSLFISSLCSNLPWSHSSEFSISVVVFFYARMSIWSFYNFINFLYCFSMWWKIIPMVSFNFLYVVFFSYLSIFNSWFKVFSKSNVWSSSGTVSINYFPVYGPYFPITLHAL